VKDCLKVSGGLLIFGILIRHIFYRSLAELVISIF